MSEIEIWKKSYCNLSVLLGGFSFVALYCVWGPLDCTMFFNSILKLISVAFSST